MKNNKTILLIVGLAVVFLVATQTDLGGLGADETFAISFNKEICEPPSGYFDQYDNDDGLSTPYLFLREISEGTKERGRLVITDLGKIESDLYYVGAKGMDARTGAPDLSFFAMPELKIYSMVGFGGDRTKCSTLVGDAVEEGILNKKREYYQFDRKFKLKGVYLVCSANDDFLLVFDSTKNARNYARRAKVCDIPQRRAPTPIKVTEGDVI